MVQKSPKSSLRLVDEALEFEMGCLAGQGGLEFGDLSEELMDCREISDVEHGDELNELVAKGFESDPDMHVPLKKLKGVRKEKSIVVFERHTCT